MDQKKVIKWGLLLGGGMVLLCCFPFTCVGFLGQMAENGRNSREMSSATTMDKAQQTSEDILAGLKDANKAMDEKSGSGKVSKNASEVSQPAVATPEPTPDDGSVALGQSFTLGDYTYRILKWKSVNLLGNDYFPTKPVQGGTFVILEYEITNSSKETKMGINFDFKLIDAKGRQFNTSSKVEAGLGIADPGSKEIFTEFQPGLTRTVWQGFEVPIDAVTPKGMMVLVPEKGMFSRGKVHVRLE